MAGLIRTNLLSNERLDLPDFNNIENFVIEDFNAIMKFLMSGSTKVVGGFRIFQDSTTLIDSPTASPVYIKLAGSSVIHSEASGTPFFYTGASTLPAYQVDLVPGSTNYVEMELTITTNAADTRAFWDPSANNGDGAEFTQIVDTARNLTAVFTVNNIGFTGGNRLPIAEIVMTGSVITALRDRRNMFFRLGTGQPEDSSHLYPWTQGRDEPNSDRTLDPDAFIGADKSIATFKEWMDAVMTTLKELKGGAYWFSPGSSLVPGINLSDLFFDTKGSVLTGEGKFQHDETTPGMLTWTSDLYLKSLYGSLAFRILAGNVTLADEEVAYVQLVRNEDFQPANTFTFTNGSLTVTGSIAVVGIAPGDWIKAEAAGLNHWTQVDTVVGNTITLLTTYPGTSTVSKAVRTQGTYNSATVASPTAVPMNGNVYVIGKRVDNGGSIPRIYLGGAGGGEIESGEEEDIGDDFSDDIFAFIGSTGKTDRTPNYAFLPNGLSPETFSQGDNLVIAIGVCVANINAILEMLDAPSYDESVTLVAPITSGTIVTIPVNTRLGGSPQQYYTVGKGALELYLNGQYLVKDAVNGWSEVGVFGSDSSDVQIDQDLVASDVITYRIDATGGPGAGGGGGGGTPGGVSGDIQYNNAGSFDGNVNFKIDTADGSLNLNGLRMNVLSSSIVLVDNVVIPTVIVSYLGSSNRYLVIEYSIVRGGMTRVGNLMVTHDGTNVGYNDSYVDSLASLGVTLTADFSTPNVRILYQTTNTGANATFKFSVRRWS